MNITAKKYLEDIVSYKPGKAKIGLDNAIKLSANENALGASPKAIKAYQNLSNNLSTYPDGSASELRNSLAKKNDIDPDKIVCGAGSDELIALITHAFCGEGDEIIYSQHGFLMYPISAKKVGATAIKVAETNLKTNIDNILAAISSKTKIIFIANPNNPTGTYLNKDEINKLIAQVPSNIIIVLDHAYEEFVTEKDYPKNSLKLVEQNENLVVTRTFSKIYGLASLRIGWCYSSQYVADILNKIRGPFNVSSPAQNAAISAINDDEFLELSILHNKKWLKIYEEEFLNATQFNLTKSAANFILIDFLDKQKLVKANQLLAERKIIAREMGAYGLENSLRITIGKDLENKMVIEQLKKIY